MGTFNTIIDKRTKCLKCGFDFKDTPKKHLNWQTKDLNDRMNTWKLGEKLIIRDGNLTFEAKGDDVWSGIESCWKCYKCSSSLIFIKNGIIKKIEVVNLKCQKCKSEKTDFQIRGNKKQGYIMNCICYKCKHEWEKRVK